VACSGSAHSLDDRFGECAVSIPTSIPLNTLLRRGKWDSRRACYFNITTIAVNSFKHLSLPMLISNSFAGTITFYVYNLASVMVNTILGGELVRRSMSMILT
jgi:hypothetical protein